MKTILSISLTIPSHKEFILRWWLLIKTILALKLKCKISIFVSVCLFFFSFFKRGPRSANLQLVQTSFFYSLHCYFFHIAPRSPLPSQISHPWHRRRGTVNVKYFGYQKKKSTSRLGPFFFLLGPFSKHCERQREEHWTEKKRRRKEEPVWARRGRAGVEEWGEQK